MKSIPQLDGDRTQKLHVIEGKVPPLDQIPPGCRFAPRCPYADALCHERPPEYAEHAPGHKVRCWHAAKIAREEEKEHVS
jgi:oligopeptide/dipeptide ABC transporter ATP-binding protein